MKNNAGKIIDRCVAAVFAICAASYACGAFLGFDSLACGCVLASAFPVAMYGAYVAFADIARSASA